MTYTRISFRSYAEDGARFEDGAFDRAVGGEVSISGPFKTVKATLISVEIEAGGSSAFITVDVPRGSITLADIMSPMSP